MECVHASSIIKISYINYQILNEDNAGSIISTITTMSNSIIGPKSLDEACSPFFSMFALCSNMEAVDSSARSLLKSAVPRFNPDIRNVENFI